MGADELLYSLRKDRAHTTGEIEGVQLPVLSPTLAVLFFGSGVINNDKVTSARRPPSTATGRSSEQKLLQDVEGQRPVHVFGRTEDLEGGHFLWTDKHG